MDIVAVDEAKRGKRIKRKDYIENALITALPVLGFFIFGAFPMVMSLIMSFFDMKDPEFVNATFVGINNFKDMLTFDIHGGDFLLTFLTVGMYTINVFVGLVIAVYIAYQLNKIHVMSHLLRTIFFVPAVCSVSVVTIVFKMFLGEYSGVFNQVLRTFGFESVQWLTGSPILFNVSMITVAVWSGIGYAVVLLQAAFASVDKSYAEAASIDGATAGQIFRKITFHAITPTLGYLLTMRLIGSLQQMGNYYQFGHGILNTQQWSDTDFYQSVYPEDATSSLYIWETPVVYLYEMAFGTRRWTYGYGIASAAAWILALVIFIVTRINFKLQEKWVSYDF